MQPVISLLHIECIGLRSICSNKCVIRAKTLNLAISRKKKSGGWVRELTGTRGGRIVTKLTKGGEAGFEFLLENMGTRKWSRRGDGTCLERHAGTKTETIISKISGKVNSEDLQHIFPSLPA